MSRNTTAGAWVRAVGDFLRAQGIDLHLLCRSAGLPEETLDGAAESMATESMSRVWEEAVRVSANPGISLSPNSAVRPVNLDVVGYAMMASPHLLAGIERMVRYTRIVSEAATTGLAQVPQGYALTFDLYGGDRPVPRQRFEFDLLALLNYFHWISGRRLAPLAVEFAHPAPPDPTQHERAFGCPVRFDAPGCRMLFASEDLLQPLCTSNDMLASMHDRYATERLESLRSDRISLRARDVIIRKLPDGEPRREDVAGILCMSERTLQRRFHDEGISFQQLLDGTRKDLAQQYLRQPNLSLAQTAYLLGFSDQSNLHRACKRWFEMSPGQYRARSEADRRSLHTTH
ncbi:AraC family transcriptional regulator [Variovorax sp. GT1P44]|uniref:AraC family transcriptional regulator n=1 Tax=Variovorax sp. GT1P44 TaxID=3443742 RepID=UPI003F47CE15